LAKKKKNNVKFESFQKIKGRMAELQLSQLNLANELGISVDTLNRKLNGIRDFNFTEIIQIIERLEIKETEIVKYFFSNMMR